MIVIADTSPINYLILIGEIEVLAHLYGGVLIPASVREELLRPRAPSIVRSWIENPPHWLEVRQPSGLPGTAESVLDPGELDAMQLAEELSADYLIIDEALGRLEAQRRGLPVIGTIGVLRDAARADLLDIREVLARLRATNFHLSLQTEQDLLNEFE